MSIVRRIQHTAQRLLGIKTLPTGASLIGYGDALTFPNRDLEASDMGYAAAYSSVIAVHRSVTVRAEAIDSLPWKICRVAGNDPAQYEVLASSADPYSHPLGRMLADYRRRTRTSFFRTMMQHRDLFGEVYCEVGRSQYGRMGLKLLNPTAVEPAIVGGEIQYYRVMGMNGEPSVMLPPDRVVRDFTYNPFDDLRGLSLVQVVLNNANIDRNLKRFLRDFFVNNARPGLVMTPPAGTETTWQEADEQALAQKLRAFYKGSGNAHSALIARKAIEVTELESPDIGRQYTVQGDIAKEIYTGFGVPLSIAGSSDATSYKEGREVYDNFVAVTILPIAIDVADYVQSGLMSLVDDVNTCQFSFDTSRLELISESEKVKMDMALEDYRGAVITLNEARQARGYEPVPFGDAYIVEGIPVPAQEMQNVWKYRYLLAPSAYNSEIITGEPLPQPADADQVIPTDTGAEALTDAPPAQPDEPAVRYAAPDTLLSIVPPPGSPTLTLTADNVGERLAFDAPPPHSYSVTAAIAELDTWERFAVRRAGRSNARPFQPDVTRGDIADQVSTALTSAADIRAVFDQARALLLPTDWEGLCVAMLLENGAWRALSSIENSFSERFGKILADMNDGTLDSRRRAGMAIRRLLGQFIAESYRQGLKDGGVFDDPSEEEQVEIVQLQQAQSPYISSLTDLYVNGSGQTVGQLEQRVRLWVNGALKPAYNAGLGSANKNALYEWQIGNAEQHCPDCIRLNGQRHRWRHWRQRNLLPGTPQQATVCRGWQCQCQLIPASGRASGKF